MIEYDELPTKDDLVEALEEFKLAQAGLMPPTSDWIDAPMLTEYREMPARAAAAAPMFELEGLVFGHPSLQGGTRFRTNAVIFGDNGKRFVRTLTGYYRLGAPAKSGQH